MDTETFDGLWWDWARGAPWLPDAMLRDAAQDVLRHLASADQARMVPLMTRCRALPEVLAAIRGACDPAWQPAGLRGAPMDVRTAFNALRLAAIGRV